MQAFPIFVQPLYNAGMPAHRRDLQSWHYRYLRYGTGSLLSAMGLRRALRFAGWMGEGVYQLRTPSRRRAEALQGRSSSEESGCSAVR